MKENKFSIIRFLSFTFLISWISWLILAFLTHFMNIKLFSPIGLPIYSLGAISPMISALIMKKKDNDLSELKKFVKSIFNLKQPIMGYAIVAFLAWGYCFFPVVFNMRQQQAPVYTALFQLPLMIFFGGGLEEVGWRGYLLPKLQDRYSATVSTILIAFIWTIWHLPLWLVEGSGQDTTNLLSFMIMVTSFSFLLTFLWNKFGSIALCILLHAGFNSFTDVYVISQDSLGINVALLVICVTIFLMGNSPKFQV